MQYIFSGCPYLSPGSAACEGLSDGIAWQAGLTHLSAGSKVCRRLVRWHRLASRGAEVKGAMSRWATGKETGLSTFLVAPLSVALKRFMCRHSTGGSWRMDICLKAARSHSHLHTPMLHLNLPQMQAGSNMQRVVLQDHCPLGLRHPQHPSLEVACSVIDCKITGCQLCSSD